MHKTGRYPLSIQFARWLSLIVALVPLVYAARYFRFAYTPGGFPDLEGAVVFAIGCIALAWAIPFFVFAGAIWRRRRWATIALATLCTLQGLFYLLASTPFVLKGEGPAWPLAFSALNLTCAVACTRATIAFARMSATATAVGFPVLGHAHPELPAPEPAPDFSVIDDPPRGEP